VVTVHDLIYRDIPSTYPAADRWIYRFKTRRSLALADKVVAISEFTRSRILQYFPEHAPKVQVIWQPCSPRYYEDSPDTVDHPLAEQPYWLSVGTVEKRKNLESVLQALRLARPDDRLPLVVFGNIKGPYAARCIRLAAQWGLKVHWNPDISPSGDTTPRGLSDLRAWYRHALGLVYPSHLEGFGLPVAEALLSRCPVITTRNSAMSEICGDQGILVDSTHYEELYEAMAMLQSDTALRVQLQNGGYQRAQFLLNPVKLSTQWMDLYRKLLEDAKP
jgi:glycosyltransferase involved in cell wall biosynthesis